MTLRTWTNGIPGNLNWSDPTYWNNGAIPQAGDDVKIWTFGVQAPTDRLLIHAVGAESLHDLTISSMNLRFSGGSLTTNGAVQIDDANFSNAVTYTLQSGSSLAFSGDGNAQLINEATGTIDLQADISMTTSSVSGGLGYPSYPRGQIVNAGLFEKTGGSGVSTIPTYFSNTGTVRIDSGSANFYHYAQSASGSLRIADGSSVTTADTVIAGTVNVGVGSHLTMSGAYLVTRSSYVTGSDYTASTTIGARGTLTGSALFFTGDIDFDFLSSMQMIGGRLSGAHWTGTGTASFLNSSQAIVASGTNTIALAVDNQAFVTLSRGSLSLDRVTGTGAIAIGVNGTLDFNSSVSSGQTLAFSGAYAQIEIDQASAFHATVAGQFGLYDTIRLAGIHGNAVALNSAKQLVVTQDGVVVATIQLSSAVYGQAFHIASDNAGGSVIGVGPLYRPIWDSSFLLENGNGQAQLWRTDGTTLQSQTLLGSPYGPGWHIEGRGDLNGDGKLDIVWMNTVTGQALGWLMDGTSILAATRIGGANGSSWSVKATGDLNGDGKADLIWQDATTGQVVAFLMDGTTVLDGKVIGNPGTAWEVRVAGDINADGSADIVLENRDGQAIQWTMNGATIASAATVGGANGANWSLVALGDLNGDGYADYLWQDENGATAGWYTNGTTVTSGENLTGPFGPGWRVAGLVDIDGNGPGDIVFQSPTGAVVVGIRGINGYYSTTTLGSPGANWSVVPSHAYDFPGTRLDFTGDAKADLIWVSTSGQAMLWEMNGLSLVSQSNIGPANGSNWSVEASGDLNGDRFADLIWRDANSGQVLAFQQHGATITSATPIGGANGEQWHVVGSGDLDGDGHDDIVLEDVSTGQAVVWLMNGTQILSAAAVGGANGANWQIRGVGDLNGDGHDDIVWQDDQGQAVVWLMNGTTVTSGAFAGGANGANWTIEGIGDVTRDGRDDIVWQNDQGLAVVWQMNGASVLAGDVVGTQRGASYHIADVADLNGDGIADIVWETDSGQASAWLLNGPTVVGSGNIGAALGANWDLFF